ncbi:DUF202 domain-containing protein [Salinisphaera hydrothermalis]|uniref:DUF202 domain-containing protein n=1 Tax=Salinisphaera hydrothermalis TaxID=563188 RepID=UPI003340824A
MAEVPIAERAGLQAERTDLSWSRTALAYAANGVLLLLRHEMAAPGWIQLAGAGLAALLLAFTLVISRRRRRILEHRPLPDSLADPIPILMLVLGTTLLALLTLGLVLAPLWPQG